MHESKGMLYQFSHLWHGLILSRAFLLLVVSLSLTGCAEGMFSQYGVLNPYARNQWYVEEQRYGFNLNSRLVELSRLRKRAEKFAPQKRQTIAQELANLLESERNPIMRSSIVLTLAAMQNPVGDQAILQRLQDDSSLVRRAACQAIAKRGGDAGIAELARVLQSDDDQDVRLTAAKELANFPKNDVAIRALGVMLDETDPALQYQAMRSLQRVTGKRFGNDVPAWREYLTGGNPPEKPPTVVTRLFSPLW